jgi:isocitrate dehydrogenase (NAD+)
MAYGYSVDKLIILEGDQTGQELLEETLRLLDEDVIEIKLELEHYDLSLQSRRDSKNEVVYQSAEAIKQAGIGLKAATITPDGADDVGSPNRILREALDGRVILRTGRVIPGVTPLGGIHHPISVVRMATNDAYGAEEGREPSETDELAWRKEKIYRSDCRAVAATAFSQAKKMQGKVYGGPKWTVSPVYEGMLKEEMDRAAKENPDVLYEPVLIDATYAGLVSGAANQPIAIPSLNRDGDLLADLVLALYGSIAGAESLIVGQQCVLAEAPHGTAPTLEGKNVANPLAMGLAAGEALLHSKKEELQEAGQKIKQALLEVTEQGVRTSDLKGDATTSEVIDAAIERIKSL